MVTTTQVTNGLVKYIDNDILPHLTGAKRLGLGIYAALAAESLDATIQRFKNNPAIAMLNVIDDAGNLDIDRLHNAAARYFVDGAKHSLDIPLLGVITIDRSDLDKLYRFIMS